MNHEGENTPIEPGKGTPRESLVIPEEGGIGSIAWSRFPIEIFPIATNLANQIVCDPKYEEAYALLKKVRIAESLLKMTRVQIVNFRDIPPREDDPDIENRWSDESIEAHKQKLQRDNDKRQTEVTRLHEELREKSMSSEFLGAYEDISARVREIVAISLAGFRLRIAEEDVFSQDSFGRDADDLIEYNLNLLKTG